MSKRNTGAVFLRAFAKTVLIIGLMFAVGFASYEAVFWYCKNNNGGKIKEKVDALREEHEGDQVIYTAIMMDDTMSSGMEGIMLKVFHTGLKNTDYIMIPTNTSLIESSKVYKKIQKYVDNLPETITIGEIGAYIKDETRRYNLTVQALEEICGVESIPYYEAYNQKVFVSIANLVDPQTMNVPMAITTKDTSGYEVQLEAGSQSINGEQAYGLLRFSGYPNGVVDQAKMAAQYWSNYYRVLAEQDTTKKKEYYDQYYRFVTCNQTEEIVNRYVEGFMDTASNQYYFHLAPGTAEGSQWKIQEEEMSALVSGIVSEENEYDTLQDMSDFQVNTVVTSSKDLSIQIYNSTNVEGLAGNWANKLREDGYQITNIRTDESGVKDHAIIYVKEDGMGLDLKTYFPEAEFITDGSLDEADIRVILGTAES